MSQHEHLSAVVSEPGDDPLAGTVYRTLRRAGAGGMGQVFEAEHTGLRRRVAVKLLSPACARDPKLADRLRLEAQALAAVRHRHVVAVHDHGVTPRGVPFLVMELLEGQTLHDILDERGPLPLPEVFFLMDQILDGLGAIHAAGLVHRDLKPANVFVCKEGGRTTVKLIDLGIVKLLRPEAPSAPAPLRYPTEQGHALGTPRFMAPEIILGRPSDARVDIYAAGVMLFLLLSGKDPFHRHSSHLALLTAHAIEAPPRLSEVASQRIPAEVDDAVARALAKDPADRFQSAQELGAALAGRAANGARGPRGTEKIGAEVAPLPGTTPLGVGGKPLVRVGDVVTIPPMRRARRPPVFGPPPPLPAGSGVAPGAARPAPPSPSSPAAAPGSPVEDDNRRLFAVVALLWCIVALVAWRVL